METQRSLLAPDIRDTQETTSQLLETNEDFADIDSVSQSDQEDHLLSCSFDSTSQMFSMIDLENYTDNKSNNSITSHESEDSSLLLDSDNEFDLITYANCSESSSAVNVLDKGKTPTYESLCKGNPLRELPNTDETSFLKQCSSLSDSWDTLNQFYEGYYQPTHHLASSQLKFSPSRLHEQGICIQKVKECLDKPQVKTETQKSSPSLKNAAADQKPTSSSPSGITACQSPPKQTFVGMRERPKSHSSFPPDNFLSLPSLPEIESESPVQFTRIKPRPRGNMQDPYCQSFGVEGSSPPSDNSNPALFDKEPRREVDEPKRPKNGFIRYSIEHRAELQQKYPYKDNRIISKLLGMQWKKMTPEERHPYEEEFSKDIHEIRSQNPQWRYAPAKRSAEELIDPMEKRLRPRQAHKTKRSNCDEACQTIWSQANSCKEQECYKDCSGTSIPAWSHCDYCSQPCPTSHQDQLPQQARSWCPLSHINQKMEYPGTSLHSITFPTSASTSAQVVQVSVQQASKQLSMLHHVIQLPVQQPLSQLSLQPIILVLPAFSPATSSASSATAFIPY